MDGEKAEAEAKPNSASSDKPINTDGENADAEAKSSSAPIPNSGSADNASGNTVKFKKKKSRRKMRKSRVKVGGKIAQLALKLDPSKIGGNFKKAKKTSTVSQETADHIRTHQSRLSMDRASLRRGQRKPFTRPKFSVPQDTVNSTLLLLHKLKTPKPDA